jgi:hypoxanthine phosphoribosyltransferase
MDSVLSLFEETMAIADVEYDTLVGIGISGALVVPTLGHLLGKNFALIRKPGVHSHDTYEFVGSIGEKWLFIDDTIDSGNTLKTVQKQIDKAINGYNRWNEKNETTQYVGYYLYAWDKFSGSNVHVRNGKKLSLTTY